MGHSFTEILKDPLTRKLLGHDAVHAEDAPFIQGVVSRLKFMLNDPTKHLSFLKIGYSALEAFLQANATGPPLDFDSVPVVIPERYQDSFATSLKQEMFQYLNVDGDDVYPLAPRIELFWLGKVVMSSSILAEAGFNGRRARFRVNFWHQKMLQEKSDTLQDLLYTDGDILEDQLSKRLEKKAAASEEHFIEFLLERAQIRTYYGDDAKAREDLALAATIRDFQFALTGALGKRTKFQDRDLSQLVVLARSREFEPEPYSSRKSSRADPSSRKSSATDTRGSPKHSIRPGTPSSFTPGDLAEGLSPSPLRKVSAPEVAAATVSTQPEIIPLNDDTVRENIQFAQELVSDEQMTQLTHDVDLHSDLAELNPGDQPMLFPVDSIMLLSIASSITNTSPDDGLTREETLPYATRVLEGGSSNWQVYTQALLVRSRIEGYRARTAERGLLQLQALVDQVIAETGDGTVVSTTGDEAGTATSTPTTFLPKLNPSQAAGVAERLKYIYQVSPPLRWELEAELAQRWTQMGGLRTALEIYERLQMQAEVALCLAATDHEAEAIVLVKSMLFDDPSTAVEVTTSLKSPQPADAPRLLCILGDIEQDPKYYMLAWNVSNKRYASAQRSLGRYFSKRKNVDAAAEAYRLVLSITRLDSSTWFALGCMQLEQKDFIGAAESFTRVVQLEDGDAEGWSNLAIALLRLPPPAKPVTVNSETLDENAIDEEDENDLTRVQTVIQPDPFQHTWEALRALRRATNLKREDARIWDNYLTVAASIPPSHGTPWNEIIQAMAQVITLRSPKEGESSVDLKILEALVVYVTKLAEYPTTSTSTIINGEVGADSLGVTAPAVRKMEAELDPLEEEVEEDVTEEDNDSDDDDDEDQDEDGEGEDMANLSLTKTKTATQSNPTSTPIKKLPFTTRALLTLIDTQIQPLATTSPPLFLLLSRVALWRNRPYESLSYTEKAWRATTSQAGVYDSTPQKWDSVVDITVQLVDAYRELGDRQREGMGNVMRSSGGGGGGGVDGDDEKKEEEGEKVPVEKAWRFKARTAVRGVMGRGKENWEGSDGWMRLEELMDGLKV